MLMRTSPRPASSGALLMRFDQAPEVAAPASRPHVALVGLVATAAFAAHARMAQSHWGAPESSERTPCHRRYRRLVRPLGFRFDVDAVIVGGVAHRGECDRLQRPLPDDAVVVRSAGCIERSGVRGSARSADRRSRRCSATSLSGPSRRSRPDLRLRAMASRSVRRARVRRARSAGFASHADSCRLRAPAS
jgi:hypothetical protein